MFATFLLLYFLLGLNSPNYRTREKINQHFWLASDSLISNLYYSSIPEVQDRTHREVLRRINSNPRLYMSRYAKYLLDNLHFPADENTSVVTAEDYPVVLPLSPDHREILAEELESQAHQLKLRIDNNEHWLGIMEWRLSPYDGREFPLEFEGFQDDIDLDPYIRMLLTTLAYHNEYLKRR